MGSELQPKRKRFGQHFLHDRHARARILDALTIEEGRPVLEIGPGGGALTEGLIERGHHVVALEIDRELAAGLRNRFDASRLTLIEVDALSADLTALASEYDVGSWTLLSNLPYNISKPMVMRLIDHAGAIEQAVLMFQSEVANRLTASVGDRDYGPLSVLPREHFAIETLFKLGPKAFRPPPAVDSSVTRWRRHTTLPTDGTRRQLQTLLRLAFASRRKTLRNNLRGAFPSVQELEACLARCELDPGLRAERLDAEQLRRLAAAHGWAKS